jgi:drug/metabolite transporter (DMT)-like permease
LRDWLAVTADSLVDWSCESRFPREKKAGLASGMINFRRLHLRTWLLLPVIVILGPLGNVLLSKGMKGVGAEMTWAPSEAVAIFIRIFTSGYIWLGIASLVTFFLIYMLMLTWADYSYVQPASALSYAVVSLLGYFWLGEAVPPMRWLGIGIICFGVLIIVGTPHRTERESDREGGNGASNGASVGRDLQGATKT